jgi:hypothetical protein
MTELIALRIAGLIADEQEAASLRIALQSLAATLRIRARL